MVAGFIGVAAGLGTIPVAVGLLATLRPAEPINPVGPRPMAPEPNPIALKFGFVLPILTTPIAPKAGVFAFPVPKPMDVTKLPELVVPPRTNKWVYNNSTLNA